MASSMSDFYPYLCVSNYTTAQALEKKILPGQRGVLCSAKKVLITVWTEW